MRSARRRSSASSGSTRAFLRGGDPFGRAARRCVGRPGVGRGRGVARGGRPGGHLRGAGLGPGAGHGPARAGGSDGARAGVVRPSATPAARPGLRRPGPAARRRPVPARVGGPEGPPGPRQRPVPAPRRRPRRARSGRLLVGVRFRWPSAAGRPQLVPCAGGGRGRAAPVVGRPSPGAGGVGPAAGCPMAEVLPGRPPPADAVGTGPGRSGRRGLVRFRRGRAGRSRPSRTLPGRAVG